MLRWALTGADANKVTKTGNAAHNFSSIYETGKVTISGKVDRINNVYDLEGNGVEWTAETNTHPNRSYRGGAYRLNFTLNPSYRSSDSPDVAFDCGHSRLMLYIKY